MHIFNRPHYTSDATEFLESLKSSRPNLEQEQRHGRSLLWDKTIDRPWQEQANTARVAQKPYVYQTEASVS